MSPRLRAPSELFERLRNEGYAVELKQGFLLLHDVPYVNAERAVLRGTLVSDLNERGNPARPATHVIHFVGQMPCNAKGQPIEAIRHVNNPQSLLPGLRVDRSFSNKPQNGYATHYDKFVSYVKVLSHPATAIDPTATALTERVFAEEAEDTVFRYVDMNASRGGTTLLGERFKSLRIGVIGVGGTGSYLTDLLAKTPVAELHLYDDDYFRAHNAFRSPGAASLEEVNASELKVDRWAATYGNMHARVIAHPVKITSKNVSLLDGLDFVFIAIDEGKPKTIIFEHLLRQGVPFIDVGLGVLMTENGEQLFGSLRVTMATPERNDHLAGTVSRAAAEDDLYTTNIQIAELNALNATLAVIRWKQYLGFYQRTDNHLHTVFNLNSNSLVHDF